MRNNISISLITALAVTISGCASIDIAKVEPEKLNIDVTLNQQDERQQLDVYLRRGMFSQPVTASDGELWVETESGELIDLMAANKKGRFGTQTRNDAIYRLTIADVTEVEFPALAPVHLAAGNELAGQIFFKDDVLELNFADSSADKRSLIFTARCNNNVYQSEMPIANSSHSQSIRIGSITQRLNNAAEADLAGMIPITLTLKEQATVVWPNQFKKVDLAASDSTEFTIDTSGFRFTANVNVQVNSSFALNFTNNRWPVQYCF